MREVREPRVAILDYGVGNLFSVKHACHAVGLPATITADRATLLSAEAVIVPGVGAFGAAMTTLRRLDLVSPLRDVAASGTPLIGICLGMQLFMNESEEFGRHEGLGLLSGQVVRFRQPRAEAQNLKVPQVGWNSIYPANVADSGWSEWPLQGIAAGEFMYFVHSYYVQPDNPDQSITMSRYGDIEFCSGMKHRNIFACQFHPERSGLRGIEIYRNIASHVAACATSAKETHA